MKRKLSFVFLGMVLFLFATPAFAQGGAPESPVKWVIISAGFSMAIA